VVPIRMQDVFDTRCKEALKNHGLTATTTAVPLLGTRQLDPKSTEAYTSRLRSFVQFLLLHPQFDDSLLMFFPYLPKGSISVEDKAVEAFLISKFTPTGTPLVDFSNPPTKIVNAKGDQLLAMGGWNDPEICDGLRSALSHVHANAHDMAGEYRNKCNACEKVFLQQGHGGCKVHASTPRPCRTGNVTLSTLVRDTIAHIKAASGHKVNGACHLLPRDLRDIRDHCVSSNDPFKLCIFTMLLLSIDLFLRKMEFQSLNEENFNTNMFVLSGENIIEALNVKVKGKKKKKKKKGPGDKEPCWRYLYIWGDDQYPDLDLKRHLLAFLYIIQWKGGNLFPSKEELLNPPEDGIYKTLMDENDMYKEVAYLYVTVLRRQDKLSVHTGRKTSYLFGYIRGGTWFDLMMAADHDAVHVAQRYAKDASSIMQVNAVLQDEKQALGVWKSPHCAGDETAVRSTRPGAEFQKPLARLVVDFMHFQIGIDPCDDQRYTPKYICEKILLWRKPGNPYNALRDSLRDLSRDRTNEVMTSVIQINRQSIEKAKSEMQMQVKQLADARISILVARLRNQLSMKGMEESEIAEFGLDDFLTNQRNAPLDLTPSAEEIRSKRAAETEVSVPKKKEQRQGEKTIDGRKNFSQWPADKKLDFMDKHADPDTGAYCNSDRQWLIRINPIAACFRNCCKCDIDHFLSLHGVNKKNGGKNFSVQDLTKTGEKLKGCAVCFTALNSM
jgi:hypothetical protein